MSRCGADGTQHSWCTSVHSELKSIGPISIGAEYISFVLRFSRLKWSCICDDISFFFHRRERPSVLRDSVSMQNHVNWFFFFSFYLHSCWGPSSFFSSSTARHWSPWGQSSRPLPDRRWRPAASPRPRCYCCPPIPSLCPSALHLGARAHTGEGKMGKWMAACQFYCIRMDKWLYSRSCCEWKSFGILKKNLFHLHCGTKHVSNVNQTNKERKKTPKWIQMWQKRTMWIKIN